MNRSYPARFRARFGLLAAIAALASLLIVWVGLLPSAADAARTPFAVGAVSAKSHGVSSGKLRKASNTRGKASTTVLFRYGWSGGRNNSALHHSTSAYDVNGDSRADTIGFTVAGKSGRAGLAAGFSIVLNGRTAKVISAPPAGADQITVSLVTLKNNRPFLFVSVYNADGSVCQELCQAAGSTLATITSDDLVAKGNVSNARISSLKPTGNKVVVNFDFVSTVTGLTRTSFTYAYRGTTLQRTKSISTALRYATAKTGGYTRKARTAAVPIAVFSDAGCTRYAFTVPKGKKARPMAVGLHANRLVYKIRYGNRYGWVRCPGSTSAGASAFAFSGTYGKTPLAADPFAYSANQTLTASALQAYDNHALYLARNEIFARHGKTFSNAELQSYFSGKPWYRGNPSVSVALNAVEKKNAALMLSIEKRRNSPYVS